MKKNERYSTALVRRLLPLRPHQGPRPARVHLMLPAGRPPSGHVAIAPVHLAPLGWRWLQHLLPKGFARIRHYGFASSAATKTRARVRLLLGCGGPTPIVLPEQKPFACPGCGGELKFLRELERLTRNLFQRGPPSRTNQNT